MNNDEITYNCYKILRVLCDNNKDELAIFLASYYFKFPDEEAKDLIAAITKYRGVS